MTPKPCPCCEDKSEMWEIMGHNRHGYECKCGLAGPKKKTPHEALAAWNLLSDKVEMFKCRDLLARANAIAGKDGST